MSKRVFTKVGSAFGFKPEYYAPEMRQSKSDDYDCVTITYDCGPNNWYLQMTAAEHKTFLEEGLKLHGGCAYYDTEDADSEV